MYKLMVVSGPMRGAAYSVNKEGETSIGRQSGNNVVLQSHRVSKRHCTLVASNGELVVRDQGSSNGTFVNGVLAKEKRLKSGDRLSVGEFVFEVVESKMPSAPIRLERNNVVAFPSSGFPVPPSSESPVAEGIQDIAAAPPAPKTLKEKAVWAFDHYVMPFFYGLTMKNEWRLTATVIFAAFCVANMFVSISPLLESSRQSVVRESARRARFMARQMADNAAPLLLAHAESRIDIGAAENAEGVKLAVVTDMESRIVAPVQKQNQYLTGGVEALFAIKARDKFRGGLETGVAAAPDVSTVVAVEPLKAFNQATARNEVIGMAVVSIDTSIATLGFGDIGLVYSETLAITALLAAFTLLVLYRLTLKPLQILNEDLDKALKGEIAQVTHEFKCEELDPLWDLINSAVQRIPRSGAPGSGKSESLTPEDFTGPLCSLGGLSNLGVVVCDADRKVVSMNPRFEDLSGIRADGSIGQELTAVARDQAFAAMVADLFNQAQPGADGVGQDFDFSGVSHHVHVVAFGGMGVVKCYALVVSTAMGGSGA